MRFIIMCKQIKDNFERTNDISIKTKDDQKYWTKHTGK